MGLHGAACGPVHNHMRLHAPHAAAHAAELNPMRRLLLKQHMHSHPEPQVPVAYLDRVSEAWDSGGFRAKALRAAAHSYNRAFGHRLREYMVGG